MGTLKRIAVTALVCLLYVQVVCWVSRAWAQGGVTSASLNGDVVDQTGSAVAGAKVTVSNKATGQVHSATTDGQGHFAVLQLPPGSYSVSVEQANFQKAVIEPVLLNIGANPTLKIPLKVGQVSQSVEVMAEDVTVRSTQSDVSNVIQTQQLQDLPLNQRSFTALVTQQPGLVQITSTAAPSVLSAATNTGSYISADGSMGTSVAYLMDGVNFSNGSITAPGTAAAGDMPGVEAIQEFKVLSHNYSAAYGGASAAVVSFATKTGTNGFHGNVYEYLRNNVFDARSFFDFGATGQPEKPAFRRNQFGGTFGGPIIKNRTFFFLNYEGLRQRLNTTAIAFVPTDCARNGGEVESGTGSCPGPPTIPVWVDPNDFSQGVTSQVVPFKSEMAAIMSLYPEPSPGLTDFGNGIAEAAYLNLQPTRQDFGLVNITHALTGKDQLQFRYQIVDAQAQGTPHTPSFLFLRSDRDQNYLIKWTRTISSALVNTATFSFLRQNIASSTKPLVELSSSQFTGNPSRQTIGVITVGQGTAGTAGGSLTFLGNDDASPFALVKNIFPFNDDLMYVRGKHTLQFGGMVQQFQWNWRSATITGGSYTFPTLNDLMASDPSVMLIHRDGPDSQFYIRTTPIAWYVEDSWRAAKRFTLNFGLRHDFQPKTLTDKGNRLGNWQRPTDTAVHVGEPYNNYTFTQFQPRVGLAYDPFGDGKTAIRAGYGIFNDFVDFATMAQGQLQWNAPQPVLNTSFGLSLLPFFPVLPLLEFPTCSTCTVPGSFPGLVTGVLLPMNSPTTQQWNVAVERELPGKLSVELTYTGSQSWHLPRKQESNFNLPCGGLDNPVLDSNGLPVFPANGVNCAPLGTGAPGITGIGFSLYSKRYDTNAFYNGFTAKISRSVGALNFNAAYTWAKNISESDAFNSNNIITGVAMASIYPPNFHLDRSESAFSRRHRFTENVVYELPFGRGRKYMVNASGLAEAFLGGWSISSLGTVQSGQPMTVFVGFDITGMGDAIDFPQRPNALRQNPVLGGPTKYFDPAAFGLPDPGHIGTASRTAVVGPGYAQFDAAVAKTFRLTERADLRFRADFFNLANHANFGLPFSQIYNQIPTNVPLTPPGAFCGLTPAQEAAVSCNPLAGKITSTVGSSRQIQFSLKLTF